MFIELAETLKCPSPHQESFVVVATEAMAERSVRQGVVGCPVCQAEYPIVDGVVRFGEAPSPRAPPPAADVETLHALLGIEGPGGYVVLIGAAARRADELAARLEGVHFIAVNAPDDLTERPYLSLLVADDQVPLRTGVARGVVVSGDFAHDPWPTEAARVALRGRRVIVEREGLDVPGTRPLASGSGLWLGERR